MKFAINTDALNRDISQLNSDSKNLKSNLEALNTSMQSLNQTWEGRAKTAYLQQYQADQKAMEELCNIIDEFIAYLGNAKKQYLTCDDRVKSVISQIRI